MKTLRDGLSSGGSGISGLSAGFDEEMMLNFADAVRTHYFDYYPHVTDTEQNEKFMKIIDQTSILEKIKKIYPSDQVDKFRKIA